MAYWQKIDFWTKIKDSSAVGGTLMSAGLIAADASVFWKSFVIGCTLAGVLIPIWIKDQNNDGKADIFQE